MNAKIKNIPFGLKMSIAENEELNEARISRYEEGRYKIRWQSSVSDIHGLNLSITRTSCLKLQIFRRKRNIIINSARRSSCYLFMGGIQKCVVAPSTLQQHRGIYVRSLNHKYKQSHLSLNKFAFLDYLT